MSKLSYSSINAKLKGMSSYKLDKEDLYELLRQNNLKSAIHVLQSEFYILDNIEDDAQLVDVEQELDILLIADIKKIDRLLSGNDKKMFETYILKYKLKCIKNVLKRLVIKSSMKNTMRNVSLWINEIFTDLNGIKDAKTIDEFMAKLEKNKYSKIIEEYIKTHEVININEIETKLDIIYYKDLFNIVKKDAKLEKMIGKQIDLYNILWIYRLNKYYKLSNEQKQNKIIPINYKIGKENINKLISANNYTDMKKILSNTIYESIFVEDETSIERNVYKYLYTLNKRIFNKNAYDISMVFSYVYLEQTYKDNVINILGGIVYNLEKTRIEEKIII